VSDPADVFILGAGFSRAIADLMPLTDELGNLVVDACGLGSDPRIPSEGFTNGYFENWLSLLAEPQPQLRSYQNTSNRALFGQVADGIATVLERRQLDVLAKEPPAWLNDLLSVLHVRRAAVLTLNYDNLVESAVEGHHLWDHLANQRITTQDILNGIPQLAQPTYASLGGRVNRTFSLLKLHGSLRWYWSPDDKTGATLQRWTTPGSFGAPLELDEALRSRLMPGREPFLVPPASLKSSYYRNLVTRELWRRASDALSEATTIYLCGYSMPATDVVFAGMIRDAVRQRSVRVVVADPRADEIGTRASRLGIDPSTIECLDGDRPIAALVADYVDRQATEIATDLMSTRAVDDSSLGSLVVSWGEEESLSHRLVHAVVGIQVAPDRSEIVLMLHDHNHGLHVLAPQPSQLGELIGAIEGCRRVVADVGGRRAPIVDLWTSPQPAGDGYRWISMTPAGAPPS
jgi:hypothetical protein